MKKYLLLLISTCCLAQTPAERQKIVSKYDQQESDRLKAHFAKYMAEQRLLIENYKKTHNIAESERYSLQRIHNGIPYFFSISNDGSSKTIRANSMYPGGELGLSVNGTGMFAGVWDGGKVRNTHQEFPNSKVGVINNDAELSAHATHVTGTVVAAGTSPMRRGIAYGASALTYDWNNDANEMADFASTGYLVSNHSYGYNTEFIENWAFGQYDESSIEIDQLANTYPYYQVVIAAGNDRNSLIEQALIENGYDLLSGTGTSKNGLTVAAVNEVLVYDDPANVLVSSFSNFGPPDDGRIKPDVGAKGVAVSSCVSSTNAAYAEYNGTSMAAPAVSGLVLLLQQHYNNVNGFYMRAASVRGLICHSAREAGFDPGPDYGTGWGLADGLAAAEIITNNGSTTILEENTLTSGQTYTKQISISTMQNLRATICWTDPVGFSNTPGSEDNRASKLRNDLDIRVFKDGEEFFPWALNADDPAAPAVREDNPRDNVERIDIDFGMPGTYTIQVTNKGNLLGGSQDFTLISTSDEGLALSVNPSDFADNIVLYPNPVRNALNFSVPNNAQVSNVSLFDILGKEVRVNSQLINNGIDVSTLTSGVYFAKFHVDGKPVVRKFIKE